MDVVLGNTTIINFYRYKQQKKNTVDHKCDLEKNCGRVMRLLIGSVLY